VGVVRPLPVGTTVSMKVKAKKGERGKGKGERGKGKGAK